MITDAQIRYLKKIVDNEFNVKTQFLIEPKISNASFEDEALSCAVQIYPAK